MSSSPFQKGLKCLYFENHNSQTITFFGTEEVFLRQFYDTYIFGIVMSVVFSEKMICIRITHTHIHIFVDNEFLFKLVWPIKWATWNFVCMTMTMCAIYSFYCTICERLAFNSLTNFRLFDDFNSKFKMFAQCMNSRKLAKENDEECAFRFHSHNERTSAQNVLFPEECHEQRWLVWFSIHIVVWLSEENGQHFNHHSKISSS